MKTIGNVTGVTIESFTFLVEGMKEIIKKEKINPLSLTNIIDVNLSVQQFQGLQLLSKHTDFDNHVFGEKISVNIFSDCGDGYDENIVFIELENLFDYIDDYGFVKYEEDEESDEYEEDEESYYIDNVSSFFNVCILYSAVQIAAKNLMEENKYYEKNNNNNS